MNIITVLNSFEIALKLQKRVFIVVDGVIYLGTPSKKDNEDENNQTYIDALLKDVPEPNFDTEIGTLFLKNVSIIGLNQDINIDIVAIDTKKISSVSYCE